MIKKIILHNNSIRLLSSIIGYSVWAFIAQYQHLTVKRTVPVCFYQQSAHLDIDAPDSLLLSITGSRKDLSYFNSENSAVHIDMSKYKDGNHLIPISRENLFLPDSIKLINLEPSSIPIKITKKAL